MYLSDAGQLILKGENNGDDLELVVNEDTSDITHSSLKFNVKATEVHAKSGNWELLKQINNEGESIIICEGTTYDNDLGAQQEEDENFSEFISSVRLDANLCQLELLEHSNTEKDGERIVIRLPTAQIDTTMDDKASGIHAIGGNWMVYELPDYEGESMTVCKGQTFDHNDLVTKGFADKISSAKPVKDCEE